MATYTITAAGVTNIDSLTTKGGADTYNINSSGSILVIDQDSRYGLNQTTSAILGAVTPSATLGGSLIIDGRDIWLIPYDTGSGNVPASNTTISKGSASGLLIGVYSALNVAPTTSGSAMPASGYIKVKQWNGTLYGTGALTGLTANATSGEKFGWIEVVGQDASTIQISRLNQTYNYDSLGSQTPLVVGQWFKVGTTDGTRATTYQIPTNGATHYSPGVFVDKAAAVNVSSATWSAGVATINTSAAHGAEVGQTVIVEGCTPMAWDVTGPVVAVTDTDTFTIAITSDPGTYTSGGTVSIPEFYPTTSESALLASVSTEYLRGRWCWVSSAGLLRFGHDGVNSTGGYIVPSGRVIRIPNVQLQSATSATKTDNTLNATINTRFRVLSTSAGVMKMDRAYSCWGTHQQITSYYVEVLNSAQMHAIGGTGPWATPFVYRCVGVGSQTSLTTATLNFSGMTLGGTFTDIWAGMGSGDKNGYSCGGLTSEVTMKRCYFNKTNEFNSTATLAFSITGAHTMSDIVCNGQITFSQSTDVTISNLTQYSSPTAIGSPTASAATINVNSTSSNIVIDGYSFGGLIGQGFRNTLLNIAGGSHDITFRNAGTAAAPLDGRSAAGTIYGGAYTRVTTTATVTQVAHGYRTGDYIYVWWFSDSATSSNALEAITVLTADTFTIAVTNAGAASGTLSYHYASHQGLVSAGANTYNIVVQNVHVLGLSASPFISSSSVDNFTVENFTGEPRIVSTSGANNMKVDSSTAKPDAPAAVASEYNMSHQSTYVLPYNTTTSGAAVAWTRSSATITVTDVAHTLQSLDRIYIFAGSDQTATSWGWKSITVTGVDTFTYTGVNAGAASGTLSYRLPDGRIVIYGNEGNDVLTPYTIDTNGGGCGFTGAGSVIIPAVNDQITWETPEYVVGYDSFAVAPFAMTSGNISDYDITYALNTGSGYGSFKNLSYPRAGGGGSAASTTVTMTSTTGVAVDDYIFGQGIADGSKVVSVDNSTTITVSVANTVAVTGTLYFNALPGTSTLPSTGYKMKTRIKANVANTTAQTYFTISATSTNTSRARLYSQAVAVTVTITVSDAATLLPVENARVYIKADAGGDLTEGDEIATGLTNASGIYTFSFDYTNNQPIVGWARKATSAPYYAQAPIGGTITSAGFTTSAFLIGDD